MMQFFVCEPCQIMFRDVIADDCEECGRETVPMQPADALSVLVFDEMLTVHPYPDELDEAVRRDEARQLERHRHQ